MTTLPPTSRPLVLITDDTYTGFEEVTGAARYRDGSILILTRRASYADDPAILFATDKAYRTLDSDGTWPWHPIATIPDELRNFITRHPVGTTGTASDRDVEVIDYDTALPSHTITINRAPDMDNWVTH